jgi:hypothetical protein
LYSQLHTKVRNWRNKNWGNCCSSRKTNYK